VQIQRDLFDLGAQLSTPGFSGLTRAHLAYLDRELARWNADLAPLREFVLPGGCKGGALLHVARTVCRRVERSVAAVPESGVDVLPYLNRLSDLLFVLAREVNRHAGAAEVLWR
jgi:cob(I)alamin adenosyltransferase